MRKIFYTQVRSGKISQATSLQIKSLFESLPDGNLEITIESERHRRSNAQNRYWWGVIVEEVADHCGYEKHDHEAAHADIVYHLMPEYRTERINRITGEVETVRASTREMPTGVFTELIERAFRWAAVDLGLHIQSPQEYGLQ